MPNPFCQMNRRLLASLAKRICRCEVVRFAIRCHATPEGSQDDRKLDVECFNIRPRLGSHRLRGVAFAIHIRPRWGRSLQLVFLKPVKN